LHRQIGKQPQRLAIKDQHWASERHNTGYLLSRSRTRPSATTAFCSVRSIKAAATSVSTTAVD